MNLRPLIPLLFSILILLGCVGLYGFGYYALTQWKAKVATQATEIMTKTQELERTQKAHTALMTLASDEQALEQYAVAKGNIVPFLETLQASGRAQGARVDVISVADAKDGAHNRIALSLSITGSFDAVMRTLGGIEYGPYDGVVTSLSLKNGSDTGTTTRASWTAGVTYSVGAQSTSTPSKP